MAEKLTLTIESSGLPISEDEATSKALDELHSGQVLAFIRRISKASEDVLKNPDATEYQQINEIALVATAITMVYMSGIPIEKQIQAAQLAQRIIRDAYKQFEVEQNAEKHAA